MATQRKQTASRCCPPPPPRVWFLSDFEALKAASPPPPASGSVGGAVCQRPPPEWTPTSWQAVGLRGGFAAPPPCVFPPEDSSSALVVTPPPPPPRPRHVPNSGGRFERPRTRVSACWSYFGCASACVRVQLPTRSICRQRPAEKCTHTRTHTNGTHTHGSRRHELRFTEWIWLHGFCLKNKRRINTLFYKYCKRIVCELQKKECGAKGEEQRRKPKRRRRLR